MSKLRTTLRDRMGGLLPIIVAGLLPVTVWLRQIDAATMARIRSRSRVFGDDGEETIDTEIFNSLLLAESLREGPEPDAAPVYGLSDDDLAAMREELLEGERRELLEYINAMLGYRTSKSGLVPSLRGGGSSVSGASTAVAGGSPKS